VRRSTFIALAGALLFVLPCARADNLAAGFTAPPDFAKPGVFWHWLDNNVSKAGITADLEQMKRVGIGSAIIANADCNIPLGKVKFGSDEWLDMVDFSAQEAERLGLHLETYVGDGWAAAGGTWVDPAHSMLRVTTSEQQTHGPAHLDLALAQPPTKLDFYRDIAVLAFPTPPAEMTTMAQAAPKVTSSDPAFDAAAVVAGHGERATVLASPTPGNPRYVQFEFAQPFVVRSFTITAGGPGLFSVQGELQSSIDGVKFSPLQGFWLERGTDPQSWSVKTTSARFYRLAFLKGPAGYNGAGSPSGMAIAGLSLGARAAISSLNGKTDLIRNDFMGAPSTATLEPGLAVDPGKIIDLTAKTQAGHLAWDAPPGNWTILRVGYTPTGSKNFPATPDATGLEVDKLSQEATDVFWAGGPGKIITGTGPRAAKILTTVFVDSWEAGSQNWTPKLAEEFKKRRGYDLFSYWPVFTGRVVDTPEKTDRFLWDFRRTIADLLAENFFGHLATLAHKSGMQLAVEPYGDGPFEDLQAARDADLIRGEFWPGRMFQNENSVKLAVSASRTYGKTRVGAESFTDFKGKWQNTPEKLKSLGDLVFTLGVNFFSLHEYALQPWIGDLPGMTMGPYGSNFNREVTWAGQSSGWFQYLARCQFLLQQGQPVADILYFNGEKVPNSVGEDQAAPLVLGRHTGVMGLPSGYDYDDCDEDVILHRLAVKDGRLVLPEGTSYRALILPASDTMTPELLRKLKELADNGATIIGSRPLRSPGLANYPACDDEVKTLAKDLWDSGKIVDRKSMSDVLAGLKLRPDFESRDPAARLLYTHRRIGDTDAYFISNQSGAYEETDGLFRVQGKVPELWDPATGAMESAPVYDEEDSRTRVPLRLDPSGSVFVVFRKTAPPIDHPVALVSPEPPAGASASTLQIQKATYSAASGKGGSIDLTAQVTALIRNGGLSMNVDPDLIGKDPAPREEKQLRIDYIYNGTPGVATALERTRVTLGRATPSAQFPPARLTSSEGSALKLETWQAGSYEIETAAGKSAKIDVAQVPPPMPVDGPWELSFPPKWGAPETATLGQLISWSDSPDAGIKYFSGTATYRKTLSIPADLIGPGHRLYLDLGEVKVIADVTLNGKDLGILWRAPFCADVTDAAQAGDNALEIRVTNLWPNRIIGDEQLPPDCEWNGNALKQWPDWLLQGRPSPTGRFTFTTWHAFTKDSPLLPSGLLGPVRLVPSAETVVPAAK
jgi:hypothetical protein